MKLKKVLAVVMSLCMVAGTVSYGAPVISQSITAQAAESATTSGFSFNQTTGSLTLSGTVDGDTLRKFNNKYGYRVKSVTAEKGTVLPKDSSLLFRNYTNCSSIDLSNADTSNVTNMSRMFDNCCKLKSLNVSGFDTSKVTYMDEMFCYCKSLTSLDVSGFDTSEVADMRDMFDGCNELTSLDVSKFDTRRVKDMSFMFGGCFKLTSIDVTAFDTSRVTNMYAMFSCCKSLTSLDLSGFDTSRVTTMGNMFHYCESLTSLDLSSFDTSKVTDMYQMFGKCSKLTTLNLSSFDTSNVKDISYMFYGCGELTSLDLSGFDTSKVTEKSDMSSSRCMFSSCNKLESLTLGENFKYVLRKAELPNSKVWVNVKAPTKIVSGDWKFAAFKNNGKNTYITYTPTYPTNIKVEYSQDYKFKTHQVRFSWKEVEGADRYAIAVHLAGKWKVQDKGIIDTSYTTPKSMTSGTTYKVAIAARVDGKWDTVNAIKNAVTVTVK
ncbi:BspA family leucine-rich repeat surface protein [Ruminococcus albus]|uniref:Surface protein n=1 Tax=Ruminococcus albus TaxID=1264 RepID=A0A1I1QHG8_RUMAL|nr:BspA family leucine-rich repeat surface protein [Ruminococcus albus]SFD18683.1 surface protein [Ruminococcus albus]